MTLLWLASVLGIAFGLGLVLTPAWRNLAARWGLVARPDGQRKIQETGVPLAGGLAVFLAATGALGVAGALSAALRDCLSAQGDMLWPLLLAAVLICAV